MCNCINRLKDKALNEIEKIGPDLAGVKIESISFDNESIVFSKDAPLQLCYPMTINHAPIGRKKKSSISLLGSYCPFCGESIRKG